MMAASPSLSSSGSTSSHLFRERAFRRCSSLPPPRTAPSPTQIPRFSASFASAPERERERTDSHSYHYSYYSRSHSRGSSGMTAAAGTLYDVLGLTAGATPGEIKAAYRRLARACHPDVVAPDRKGASAGEFMRVHAAYATLSDPDKRAEYDRRVTSRRAAPFTWNPTASSSSSPASPASSYSSPASPSSSFGRRTWETDQCW